MSDFDPAPAPLVSVVAPVYNEVDSLPELMHRLSAAAEGMSGRYRFEFILVDASGNPISDALGRSAAVRSGLAVI